MMTQPPVSPQNWPIVQLPGLSPQDQTQLQALGITTTLQLLHQAQTPHQRQTLAQQVDVRPQIIQKWVALADLARIPGVGCQYCGLLLHGGMMSVGHVADSQAPALHRQVSRLHQVLLKRRDLCPSLGEVQHWITQARRLNRP